MSVAAIKAVSPPLPPGLATTHPFPKTPWKISEVVFARMKEEAQSGAKFKSCLLEQSDPDAAFVLAHFLAQKPPNLAIKSIHCIHNSIQTQVFEGAFLSMEQEAASMPPVGKNEEPKAARTKVLQRWKEATSQFPIVEMEKRGILTQANVLPLWHGTRHADAICSSGFTFFGKHHFFDKQNANAGANASTDIGYFGSGIYFTNSAHYASMYNSSTLLLAWVTMREPYPVVKDVPIPRKGKDMIKLQGKHAYQNYNAHYIPVTSVDPTSPDNMVYHPCYETEVPAWDEYVVFNKFQALPRFKIELEVDFPKAPSYKPPIDQLNHKSQEPPKKEAPVVPASDSTPATADPIELLQKQMKMLELQLAAKKAKKESESKSVSESTIVKTPVISVKPVNPEALHKAAREGNIAILKELLADKQYLAIINSNDGLFIPPLIAAANSNNSEAVLFLIKSGADLAAKEKYGGCNILHRAVENKNSAMIQALLPYKSQLLEGRDSRGRTPLHLAIGCYSHHSDAAVDLLIKAGADVTATDYEGENVLHKAASNGYEMVNRFLPYKGSSSK